MGFLTMPRAHAKHTDHDTNKHYRVRKTGVGQPEVRLLLAVLEDALWCFRRNLLATDQHRRELFEDAEAWIMADHDPLPFSFSEVCEVLGINPCYLQRRLRAWREQRLSPTTTIAQNGRSSAEGWSSRDRLDSGPGRRERPMGKSRRPYPEEFKRQLVEMVRAGRSPEKLADRFGPTAQSIRNWVKQAKRDRQRARQIVGSNAQHSGHSTLGADTHDEAGGSADVSRDIANPYCHERVADAE